MIKKIKKYSPKAFWSGANHLLESIGSLLISIIFIRLASEELYGQFLLILSIFGIFTVTSIPGIRAVIIRSLARKLDGTFDKAIKLSFQYSALGIFLLILTGSYLFFFKDRFLGLTLIVTSSFFPFVSTFRAWIPALKGKGMFKKLAIFNFIKTLGGIILIFLAITFSGQSLAWIAFTYFLNNSLFNLFYCRKITQELQNNKFTPNLKRQSFSLSITEMSNLAFGRIDILLLGTLMPIEQVAIYGLVMKSGAIFTKAARNVMQIFLPKIIKDNQIKLGKFSGIFVFSLIAPFAIIPIFHIFIPFFYGPNFQEVVSFSSIYIFILPISFVYLISGFFLLKYDLDKQNNFNRIIGMTGVIVAYLILIPKLGILGGIIGSFIYYGTISILNLISISKYLKNKVS